MLIFDEVKLALKNRAEHSLFNTDEVSEIALDIATNETLNEVKNKIVPLWAVSDFAYIRLKFYLKITLDDADIVILKLAKQEIDKSITLNGEVVSGKALVGDKVSVWG